MEIELRAGDTITGEVVSIKPYGAFVRLPTGETGLIHISEVDDDYVKDVHDYLSVGQEVAVKVVSLHEEGKYNLSIRQLTKRERESAHYSKQVREFSRALETRRKELQMEASWRTAAKERRRWVQTTRASLIKWIKTARQESDRTGRRAEERMRAYGSLDF